MALSACCHTSYAAFSSSPASDRRSRNTVVLLVCALTVVVSPAEAPAQTRVAQAIYSRPQAPDSGQVIRKAQERQASFERQRRQMLPRFYPGTPHHCLIVGRFCQWHANLSGYRIPEEGEKIRRARARLLQDLEQAGNAVPGDEWIIGQRVRYLVERRDTSAIRVARSCAARKWWCDALTGYALHTNGDFVGADSAFALALDGMPSALRCHWINVSPLLDSDLRKTFRRLPCPQREARLGRIWWMADPLLMTPGNERRTEHFSRVLHTALSQEARNTHGLSWGGDLAELTVRFGWPEKWTQQPSQSMYPGVEPAVTGHEREPGFHFFLTAWPPDSLGLVTDSLWEIDQFPPQEKYAPLYARAFVRLDAQVARFRRGDSTLVVAAYDVSRDTLFRSRRFRAALIAMGDEALPAAIDDTLDGPKRHVLTVTSPWKSQIVGVELLAADSAAAARWRSGFSEIPLEADRMSVSDLLFVDGGSSLPGSLADAIPRAHGGTVFARDTKAGLFWELYGEAPADSALPISLTISPLETGLLRSALGALRVAAKPTPLNIRWQENGASGVLSARSLLLDLSLLPPGKYEVKLEVGATRIATTRRIIRIR